MFLPSRLSSSVSLAGDLIPVGGNAAEDDKASDSLWSSSSD